MGYLRRLGTALTLSLTTVVACGSDDEGLTSAQFAAEYCALYRPCCQAAGLPVTQQGCNTLFGFIPLQDAAAAQQCLDAWKVRAQDPNFCKLWDDPGPEVCQRAFPQGMGTGTGANTGTAPPGATCDFESDCASSPRGEVSCNHSFSDNRSFCQVRVPVTLGAPCAGTLEKNYLLITGDDSGPELPICLREQGLYCEDGSCQASVANGGACSSSAGCSDGYCASGVCTPRLPAGSSCRTEGDACDEQSRCDLTSQTCVALVPEGGPCQSGNECVTAACGSDGKCTKLDLGGAVALLLFCA